MTFRPCLNTATIKPARLEEKVKAAAAAGYEGIGVWFDDVAPFVGAGNTIEDAARMIRDAGLEIPEFCTVGVQWQYVGSEQRAKALDEARPRFEMAAALGAACILASTGQGEGTLDQAVDDFVALCEYARPFGVNVALEFLGFREQLNNVGVTWEIVRRADQANGGLLVDTFHLYRGRSRLDDLRRVDGSKIFLVHIDDAIDKPIDDLTDPDRVHVGRGILPLDDMLDAIAATGYEGFVSIELFNRSYWDEDPRDVARTGKTALDVLLA